MFQRLVDVAERLTGLDRVSGALDRLAGSLFPSPEVKDLASGTWLGHALHPPLTDVTLGAWFAASVLDLSRARAAEGPARTLVGLGVLTSLPTAVAGLADWSDTHGRTKRLGTTHAVTNGGVLALYLASWVSRRSGRHGVGRGLGLAGATGALLGSYLGGHLLMRRGVGVDHTAFLPLPPEWTDVMGEDELEEGIPRGAEVGEVPVLLVRRDGVVRGLVSRCSHRGGPLAEGDIDEVSVTCPWHGSTFSLEDGSVVTGPATAPQPALEVRSVEGRVQVRAPG